MTDRIPDTEGVIPPPGYVLVENQDGDRFWVDPASLKVGPQRSELTEDQIQRVTQLSQALSEVELLTLEQLLDGFRRDQNPEKEIRFLEHMAAVYEAELAERETADLRERKLLFRVIMTCSFSPNVDDVLGMLPDAKALPNFAGVVDRFVGQR